MHLTQYNSYVCGTVQIKMLIVTVFLSGFGAFLKSEMKFSEQ